MQVFDDGAKIYVQFGDLKRVPAIFADTPRGRVVLRWEAQPPYAIVSSPERRLIFQIGSAEAVAQKAAAGTSVGTSIARASGTAASEAGGDVASKPVRVRAASGVSTDALWYVTTPAAGKAPAASVPALQANVGAVHESPVSTPQAQHAAGTSGGRAPAAQTDSSATSALWYVTK